MTPATSIYEYAKHVLAVAANKTAIWFYDKPMSFRELFQRIDNLADHLYQLGVREGTAVTIHLPNCPQAVMAIYAVAKLGGICNMVHHLMPTESLRSYLSFTESGFLISTSRDVLEQHIADVSILVDVKSYTQDFTSIDVHDSGIDAFDLLVQPNPQKARIPDPKNLAEKCAVYMHSSGTTGVPKTVMLSHKAVNTWVEYSDDHYFGISAREMVYLSAVPPYHCFGFIVNIHQATAYGAPAVMLENWDCNRAVDSIIRYGVTSINHVPAVFGDLLRNPNFCGDKIKSIKYCIIGGEKAPVELMQMLNDRVGNGIVTHSGLGSTETGSAYCATYLPDHKIEASGYAMKGCTVLLLDADGAVKTYGEGELLVISESMMMGYLKDPEATREATFVHNGQTFIRTGDYARIDPDGAVYYIGRIKDIIIRKGHNVIPEEVEKVIRKVPGVSEVCVLGIPDPIHATQMVSAAVVANGDVDPVVLQQNILRSCEAWLPRYSIPQKIRFFEYLPRNQVGKLDINSLREGMCAV